MRTLKPNERTVILDQRELEIIAHALEYCTIYGSRGLFAELASRVGSNNDARLAEQVNEMSRRFFELTNYTK